MPIAWERGDLARLPGRQFRDELRQFRVGKAGVPMMYAVIGFVEQGKSDEPSERSF